MNKSLHKDAVKSFKVIQRIMGDRDRDRPVGVRHTESSSSLHLAAASSSNALLEEERWLLGEGVMYGEMRDEIYCQVIKQLSGNNNTYVPASSCPLLLLILACISGKASFVVGNYFACC
jgi:Rho GTPase-activating protein 39